MQAAQSTAQGIPHEKFVAELETALFDKVRDRTRHPFVRAVREGKATKNQIAGWLHQFSLWADPTNKLFGVLWAGCPDDDIRHGILENMLEEEYGESSKTSGHMQLIANTLDELDWDKKKRDADNLQMESYLLKHWFEVVMRNRSFVEGLSALSLSAERINPLVFGELEKGIREHYNLSEKALQSFAVHASDVEEEHGSLAPTAIARYATTPRMQDAVRTAVIHTADVYFNQYNVWQRY